METNWIKLSERKPEDSGKYVVVYADPYITNDSLTITIRRYDVNRKSFENEITGANYIAFWLDCLDIPHMSRDERNLLVKLP